MKRIFKKISSVFLTLAIVITSLPIVSTNVEATNRTINDAVSWIKARADEGWNVDVDGEHGCQCVDLIYAYYEYLGYARCGGSAYQYAYGSFGIPSGSGWYKDTTPSPGAIIVWPGYTYTGSWTTREYGHIGLVYAVSGSAVYTVESNVDNGGSIYGGPARYRTRYPQNAIYIHPDFPGTVSPSPIEYETIQPSTYFIISKSDGKALNLGNNEDRNTNNVHMYTACYANRGEQMVITEAPDGYKIRPIDSTRILNPYGDYAQNGQNVNIYDDVNNSSQWWKFQKVDGGYIIRNAQNPNLALDNAESDNAAIYNCHGGDNQVWELIPAAAPEKAVINSVKSSYEAEEAVTVNWNGTAYTNQYNISLEKKTNGEYKEIHWEGNVSSGYKLNSAVNLEPGDYRVRVASVNNKLLADYSVGSYYLYIWGDYVNFTVKAKAPATYTVEFNANGGKGTMSNVVMTVGKPQNLPANAFTRSGYDFLGWSKDKNASTATYKDKQSVKDLAQSGSVTLYAVWKKSAAVASANFDITAITEHKVVLAGIRFDTTDDNQYGVQTLTYTIQFDPKVLRYSEDSYFPYASTNVNTKRADEGIVVVTTILTADPNVIITGAYLSTMQFDIITSDSCKTSIKVSANNAYGAEGKEISINSKTISISLNEFTLGDINGDGKVNSLDALWALQAASENRSLTSSQFLAADVNEDGKVNSLDALWILQAASGNRQL